MAFIAGIKNGSGGTEMPITHCLYGTCATAAATAAKVVTCTAFDTFKTGMLLLVKFTYSNSVANPTLNVNSKGAKTIYRYGTTAPSTSAKTSWNAGSVVGFVYDGTYWQMLDWLNDDTTYSTVSKTAAGLAPQLPNETTTTKYLRQDGSWQVPPNTTTGTTYAAANVPNNTTFGTNGSIKAVYDACKNQNLSMTALWTNASPSSSFTPQSITVSGSGYLFYYIVFTGTANGSYVGLASTWVKVGDTGSALGRDLVKSSSAPNGDVRFRAITETSATKVTFGKGYNGTTESNDRMVPYIIYGVK